MHNNSYICSAGSGWPCLVAVCVPLLQPHPGGNSRTEGSPASQVYNLIEYQWEHQAWSYLVFYFDSTVSHLPVLHLPVLPARHGRPWYSILIDCTVRYHTYGTGNTSKAWSSLVFYFECMVSHVPVLPAASFGCQSRSDLSFWCGSWSGFGSASYPTLSSSHVGKS